MTERELCANAVVFAPHPDDEVLGCGGTIVAKLRAGARVGICFLTDGSLSHRDILAPEKLALLRHSEAFAAAAVLGVPRSDVSWLKFQDGSLQATHSQAVACVAEVLHQQKPAQVFLPYRLDEHADHTAARTIVLGALTQLGQPAVTFEYPIWFMRHWPWMETMRGARFSAFQDRRWLMSSLRLLRDFDVRVELLDLLDVKRRALSAHRSQMEKFNGEQDWTTLDEIFDGDFLRCFLRAERFRTGHFDPRRLP